MKSLATWFVLGFAIHLQAFQPPALSTSFLHKDHGALSSKVQSHSSRTRFAMLVRIPQGNWGQDNSPEAQKPRLVSTQEIAAQRSILPDADDQPTTVPSSKRSQKASLEDGRERHQSVRLWARRDFSSLAAIGCACLIAPRGALAKKRSAEQNQSPALDRGAGQSIPLEPVLGTCCPCPVGETVEFSDDEDAKTTGQCDETYTQVSAAIAAGYRWIDTATHYNNEKSVGKAIADATASGLIQPGEVQTITKVWFDDMGYEKTLASCEASMARLGVQSLGCVLVHFPGSIDAVQSPAKNKKLRADTWKALEELKRQGRVRRIGVSNFVRRHLRDLLAACEMRPDMVQMEIHPYCQQPDMVQYCKDNGIQVVAFSPFAHGDLPVLTDRNLGKIAGKHGKSTAQVVLKWLLQDGIVPVVKASTAERLRENRDLAGFELDTADQAAIRLLDTGKRVGFDPNQIA